MSAKTTLTMTELAQSLRSGTLPLHAYLNALEAHFDATEPQILAFVPEPGRFERLHQEAAALLAHYPYVEKRPSFFGIPIGVKDIFQVNGFVTRAGSQLPTEILQGPEAPSVTVLKQAGALILGKTVTTEFAYFAPGPTRNPHNPAHTPGGSSSGSAAAVAAGLAPFAFGTQTIGSISRPAAFCGIVGYKPSYDRISREGVLPLSESADHIGFFTPAATDVALAAPLLCANWKPVQPLRKPVLGIPTGPYLEHASDAGLKHFESTTLQLKKAGYEIKRVTAMADFEAIFTRHNQLVAAETAHFHAAWFAQYSDLYHPKTAELILRGKQIGAQELADAKESRFRLRAQLTTLMQSHGIDLWIAPPAVNGAPAGLESTGDPVMNLPWTHAGLPTLCLPAGTNSAGLPMGLQIVGNWYQDEDLVAWGAGIEASLTNAAFQ